MPESIRALVVVIVLAIPAFFVAGRIARPSGLSREFSFWRNAWFAATLSAFLSPNVFIFCLPVVVICIVARSARMATVDLYVVLLLAVPPIGATLGGFGGVQTILDINNARLLAIILLLPILIAPSGREGRIRGVFLMPDIMLVSYVLLLIALELRRSELTGILRAAALHTLDILLPYLALSRTVTNLAAFRRVAFALFVAVLPLAFIAVFETSKGWPLYSSIAQQWGGGSLSSGRGGMLRAAGSALNSIALGFTFMVAIGCILAARQPTAQSKRFAAIALALLIAGLVSALSRGPWVGGLVLAIVYLATGPRAAPSLARFGLLCAAAIVLMLLTPLGEKLINYLPFIGSGDLGSVEYRQALFDAAIQVIERNLLLGSVDYISTPEMKAMVQGQGIVDIVNTYLRVALNSGLIGLALFVGFFVSILFGLRRISKVGKGRDIAVLARASAATLLAILVTIATVSSVEFIPYLYWLFAGLCVALVRVVLKERAVQLTPYSRPVSSRLDTEGLP